MATNREDRVLVKFSTLSIPALDKKLQKQMFLKTKTVAYLYERLRANLNLDASQPLV